MNRVIVDEASLHTESTVWLNDSTKFHNITTHVITEARIVFEIRVQDSYYQEYIQPILPPLEDQCYGESEAHERSPQLWCRYGPKQNPTRSGQVV